MRARWTQRRAWAVWVFASLMAWIALGTLVAVLFKNDARQTAEETESFPPSDIAPAAGSSEKKNN